MLPASRKFPIILNWNICTIQILPFVYFGFNFLLCTPDCTINCYCSNLYSRVPQVSPKYSSVHEQLKPPTVEREQTPPNWHGLEPHGSSSANMDKEMCKEVLHTLFKTVTPLCSDSFMIRHPSVLTALCSDCQLCSDIPCSNAPRVWLSTFFQRPMFGHPTGSGM